MPNLLSSLTHVALPEPAPGQAISDTPVKGNLLALSDGSAESGGFAQALSQSLGQMPEVRAQWVTAGDDGLETLPHTLPLAGNLLPPEQGEPSVTLGEGSTTPSAQQWLAVSPVSVLGIDTAPVDGEATVTDNALTIEGRNTQPSNSWIRNTVLMAVTGERGATVPEETPTPASVWFARTPTQARDHPPLR